jgi:hypothetical protein
LNITKALMIWGGVRLHAFTPGQAAIVLAAGLVGWRVRLLDALAADGRPPG